MSGWETGFKKAVMDVRKELNAGKLIQEESIKVSLYYHLRKNLEEKYGSKYTLFTEFKYYWEHCPPHEGYNFDIAILKDWNPDEEMASSRNTDKKAKEYRYDKVAGLIEIKLASSLNRMLGKPDQDKSKVVSNSDRDEDIEKFRKLWRHPSHLQSIDRAYLCLFEEGSKTKGWEKVEFEINDKNVPKEKILVRSIHCNLRR